MRTGSLRAADHRASNVSHWLWVGWLVLLIALTYKMKVLGELAFRPYYLPGVAIGFAVVLGLYANIRPRQRLQWTSIPEVLIVGLLLGCIGYLTLQPMALPGTLRPVLYATATVFLCYALTFLSVATVGWLSAVLGIYRALLVYSVLNVAIVAGGLIYPPLIDVLPVPPLESGFGLRISGLPGDPTHFGALVSVTLMLLFVLRQQVLRWWSWPLTMVLLVALAATGSRNAILSMLLGMAAAAFCDSRLLRGMLRLLLIGLAVGLLALAVILTVPDAGALALDLFRVDDPNAYSRFAIWSDMLDIAGRLSVLEWIFGGGFLFIQDIYGSPYNAFLRLFFNHGLTFLAPLLVLVSMLFAWAIIDRDPLRRQIELALLTYWLSFSMFLDTSFAEFFHVAEFVFWVAAALLTTRSLQRRRPLHRLTALAPNTAPAQHTGIHQA